MVYPFLNLLKWPHFKSQFSPRDTDVEIWASVGSEARMSRVEMGQNQPKSSTGWDGTLAGTL